MARLAAGVRKRSDGKLEKRITINGQRKSIYGNSQKEIEEKEQKLRQEIQNGSYTVNKKLTLNQYFDEWIKRKQLDTKGNTRRQYISFFNTHISPALGKRKIAEIERREIIRFQEQLATKVNPNSVNTIMRTLKTIFNDAVKDDIIVKSPALGIRNIKPQEKASETYHRALTEKEQALFMQELKENYYYNFIALLLCTGMRLGEAAALTWQDIDRKNNVIHISKTITRSETGEVIVGSPKSSTSNRIIPMNETIKAILQNQKQEQSRVYYFNKTVFTTVYGQIVTSKAVNRAIDETLVKMGNKGHTIERFTAHALRDTFATRFIEQGGSPQTLKTILGHSSLAITMDLYSHVLPNTKQKEMDNLHIVL